MGKVLFWIIALCHCTLCIILYIFSYGISEYFDYNPTTVRWVIMVPGIAGVFIGVNVWAALKRKQLDREAAAREAEQIANRK